MTILFLHIKSLKYDNNNDHKLSPLTEEEYEIIAEWMQIDRPECFDNIGAIYRHELNSDEDSDDYEVPTFNSLRGFSSNGAYYLPDELEEAEDVPEDKKKLLISAMRKLENAYVFPEVSQDSLLQGGEVIIYDQDNY